MERRLDKIAKQLGGDEPDREQILFVDLNTWSAADQERYLAGDAAEQDQLVEQYTGRQPPASRRAISMIIDMPAGTVGPDLTW